MTRLTDRGLPIDRARPHASAGGRRPGAPDRNEDEREAVTHSRPTFEIVAATAADIPVITRHRVAMFRDMNELQSGAEDALARAAAECLAKALPLGEYLGWVARSTASASAVIGGAGVQLRAMLPRPRPGGAELEVGPEAVVLNVYVEPSWRRRGVAEALMRSVLADLETRGVRRVVLHASDAGRRLYERLGFVPTTEMRLTAPGTPAGAGQPTPDVEVRSSPIEGLGLFAARPFAPGDRIRRVTVVREVTPEAPLRPELGERADHCDYPDGKVVLIGFPDRHINHSCDPNAHVRYQGAAAEFIARRPIARGDEITCDYNINISGGTAWPCHCGAARCLGTTVGDFFRLPLAVQREYRPLLASWFVRRHADALAALDEGP